jgi:5'-3' exonuclease
MITDERQPLILIIDGYNFLHRARSGFQMGSYNICFNFFRNLRALVEQFKPSRVIFITEGHPQQRLESFPEYKAQRRVPITDPKKQAEMDSFLRQKSLILKLLESFPISVMRHPEHEADDVIYNLIKRSSTAVPWVVASNDTDFIQLLNEFDHVKLYNPMTKEFVIKPDYDYVNFKSLKGDGSDNIPGIPGVGAVTAMELARDGEKFKSYMKANPGAEDIWARNFDLIHFFEFNDHDQNKITSSSPVLSPPECIEQIRIQFDEWKFQSILKEPSWTKYVATFATLYGPNH